MAIRQRNKSNDGWQVYWNNPFTGKRENRLFPSKGEAEAFDSLTRHQLKYERHVFAPKEPKPVKKEKAAAVPTLQECYFLYLKEKQFSKKGLTWQMDCMRTPLNTLGNKPITSITRAHIEKLMACMLQKNVKPITVRARLSVLRTVLRWCAAKNFLERMLDFPRLPPAYYEKFIPPTPEELERIIAVASPHVVRAIVLGAQLGVRVGESELAKLTWDDVDLERAVVRVHGAKKNMQCPWREVPIRKTLIEYFSAWKNEDASLGMKHLIHYNGKPVGTVKKAWRATLIRAGITRRIRPYDLRHAFATELIASGADVGTVAKLMGHSNPIMLLNHYQHVLDRQKKDAVENLPSLALHSTFNTQQVRP